MDFSVIVPVYKEEGIINSFLDHLISVFQNSLYQIIVVEGDKDSSTLKAIKNEQVIKIKAQRGRSIQMNSGAGIATGRVLIFVHCDTFLPENTPSLIENCLSGNNQAGAFDIRIASSNKLLKVLFFSASLRSRITGHPYGDQVHFFCRDYFNIIGQYKEIPVMEDIEIMQRIKKRGEKVFIINKPVFTSDRRWLKEGILYVLLRNPILTLLYYLGVSPHKLKKYYS